MSEEQTEQVEQAEQAEQADGIGASLISSLFATAEGEEQQADRKSVV